MGSKGDGHNLVTEIHVYVKPKRTIEAKAPNSKVPQSQVSHIN